MRKIKLRGFLAILTLLAVMPGVALAQKTVPEWRIVPGESHIEFEGTQMGAAFQGSFPDFSGKILFDPANLAASSADITIDIGSADAKSSDRNRYMRMADWFHVDLFPQARFTTTAIEQGLGNNQYVAKGDLTIRDVTLPVVLPFTLDIAQPGADTDSGAIRAKMAGETIINRLDYGVGQGQWADTKTVANPIKLRISIVATKLE